MKSDGVNSRTWAPSLARKRAVSKMDGQQRSHPLDGAGGPQGVADHGLGRADRDLIGSPAENGLDRPGLHQVVGRRKRAVGVDVVHRLHGHPGIGIGGHPIFYYLPESMVSSKH